MIRFKLFLFIPLILLFSCETKKESTTSEPLKAGQWRGVIRPQGLDLPFNFTVSEDANGYRIELINAEERIPLDEVSVSNDSVHIPMYIFDATIHAKIVDAGTLRGFWVKNYAMDYVVPFEAKAGDGARFATEDNSEPKDFSGKWEADFITDDKVRKLIGVFEQDGRHVTGTFVNTTGDYRFLEGAVNGNTMQLSCFDGTHAYLFHASMKDDGTIDGEFWSGKTWHQRWTAKRNPDFELPDPYAMTHINEGYDQFDFSFPNTSGELVSLSDEKYQDKVVVVQILGSWCPNCMDESRFFAGWHKANKSREVEFIGLAFERKDDFDYACKRVLKMKEKLGIDYEVLIAGTTSEESKAKALPMLNKIMSFPTSIFLDKNHQVKKIHTGFSGPGTGDYYDLYVTEFNTLMEELLSE